MLLTSLTGMGLVYIICVVIFGVLSLVSIALHFYFRYRRENSVMVRNGKPEGIWEFTKKNFWMFCFLVFAVFAFACLMLYIGA